VTEFTGERVIPGLVNDDLWAEHVARYAFAARFAAGRKVLDAGCGTGYGAAELTGAASVTGIDIARDAVAHGQTTKTGRLPHCSFVQAFVEAMPFRAASFDLVVAFEVIEHIADWRGLLREVRRVLAPHGLFIVSTPNRAYYNESRGREGPNPYHVHEFEFEEFREALQEFFPQAEVFLQNWVEGVAVQGINEETNGREAHFFIGVSGDDKLPEPASFVYVPRAANLLRERERHIRKLEAELEQTKAWLDAQIRDHVDLQRSHEELTQHLEEKNRWGLELERNWRDSQDRVVQLQEELKSQQLSADQMSAGYERQISELEAENRAKTEWAVQTEARLTADLTARAEQLAATVRLLDRAEATVIERTEWAQRLDAELAELRAQLDAVRESRWVKLGRSVGVGPKL
jgi:ubiquinone/menaquinone biosynthesis C-methylase UbiE